MVSTRSPGTSVSGTDVLPRSIGTRSAIELQLLIDSVQDYAIFLLDPQGRVSTWNPAAERMKGYRAEEIIGRSFALFYVPEEIAAGKPQRDLETAASHGHMDGEGWRVRKDGSLFWAAVGLTALRDSRGEITGFGRVTRDLTHRKWAEEEKFGKIFRSSPTALCMTTEEDHRFVEVNPEFCRLTGYSREELIGRTSSELQLWPDSKAAERASEKSPEIEIRTKSSELRTGLVSFEMIEMGGQSCRLSAIRDITERRRMEEQLRVMNVRLQEWVTELERRTEDITQVSRMADLLQSCLSIEEAYQVISHFSRQLFPSACGALYMRDPSTQMMESVANWGVAPAGESSFEPEHCWALRRGRAHVVESSGAGMLCSHLPSPAPESWLCLPLMAKGEALGVYHLQLPADQTVSGRASRGLAEAVADHVSLALGNLQIRESLRKQSTRDALTGLFNRRYMEESVERELRRAARNQRSLGAIMIDVDNFKSFNDDFGHEAGDLLLKELGAMLLEFSRKDDIACRYGGEEFTLILPEATLEASLTRAEQLRQRAKGLMLNYRGSAIGPVTLSFGVAAYPENGVTVEELLRSADMALYQAKREGRDRVAFALP